MAELVIPVSDALVAALHRRAERHGRTPEAEHLDILEMALSSDVERVTFKELLLRMPNVGEDADFHAPRGPGEVSS